MASDCAWCWGQLPPTGARAIGRERGLVCDTCSSVVDQLTDADWREATEQDADDLVREVTMPLEANVWARAYRAGLQQAFDSLQPMVEHHELGDLVHYEPRDLLDVLAILVMGEDHAPV